MNNRMPTKNERARASHKSAPAGSVAAPLLNLVERHSGLTASEYARRLGLRRSIVSSVLNRLSKPGQSKAGAPRPPRLTRSVGMPRLYYPAAA